jgi:predicted enzyme related to lactoylglutathione lyase
MGEPVVHWEIGARDANKLQAFYAALFDWKIDAGNPMEYGMVHAGGSGGIDGGIMNAKGEETYLTIYVQVSDLQDYIDRAESLGGRAVLEPTPIPGVGSIAAFRDPEENLIGLFSA